METCRRGPSRAHLDSLCVLFVEGANVESICCVDFSPGGDQGRGVLAKQGEQSYKGKSLGLSNWVQIRQSETSKVFIQDLMLKGHRWAHLLQVNMLPVNSLKERMSLDLLGTAG